MNVNELEIVIIGAGALGGSVARGLAARSCHVTAVDPAVERAKYLEKYGVKVTADHKDAVSRSDVILFAVKPHLVVPVARGIQKEIESKLCFSLAAGLELSILCEAVPGARWIRIMTNICSKINSAFTGYAPSDAATAKDISIAEGIFSLLGMTERTEERFLDAITAISGSGPAYIYTVLEAFVQGGLLVGLPSDLALKASACTMIGASKLLLEAGEHPAELKDRVCTPAGTTIEGLYELENGGVRPAFIRAVKAATERGRMVARQVGSEARKQLDKLED